MPTDPNVITVEPEPYDLATLAQVKEYLEIDSTDTSSDSLLSRLITASSSFIQSILNRQFAVASYTDRIGGRGGAHVVLSSYPIQSVASVSVCGRPIPAATDDTAPGYIFDDLAVYLRGYRFERGVQNVTITYAAGFTLIPSDVTDCCIELVGKKFKYKDRIGQVSKILGGETVTFEASDLTDDMKSVLRNYQKVVPV